MNFTNVAGYIFNIASIIAIDMTKYSPNPPSAEETNDRTRQLYFHRSIKLVLLGPTTHVFEKERADAMHDWYLTMSGQRTAEIVSFPERMH